jgi:toxin ParE1/3/4
LRRLEVARAAQQDIATILHWSRTEFGAEAANRYRELLAAAITKLRNDPLPANVRALNDLGVGLRSYHLRHAAPQTTEAGRVRRPRHFIIFRADAAVLQIVRVLHESMDLPRRLSDDEAPQ